MTASETGKKQAIVILNGISLKKKIFYHEYMPVLSRLFNVEVHETLSKNDAVSLAGKFTEKYVDIIFSAGGDGTLHQVVNGILKGRENYSKLPVVGVIPIGSGNDFARGAGGKTSIRKRLQVFEAFRPRPVDVGMMAFSQQAGDASDTGFIYFINVADIGMGPDVVGRVAHSGRPFGSAVAYYKSILNTFMTFKPVAVRAAATDWVWEGKIRSVAVANGRYYGHGLCVAPDAEINDRKFAVFICGDVSIFDFIRHTGTLKRGKYIRMEKVHYKEATAVRFTSEAPCPIQADGELVGWLPARVSMIDRQLNFLI